jgi:cation diffusion facilitator CzcD-associated flavoprotein CzcO
MTPGSNYLQSLLQENVQVIADSAVELTAEGIVDASGREAKVDVVICATGLNTAKPSYEIIGRKGRNLGEYWAEGAKGYMSCMADGFSQHVL